LVNVGLMAIYRSDLQPRLIYDSLSLSLSLSLSMNPATQILMQLRHNTVLTLSANYFLTLLLRDMKALLFERLSITGYMDL